MTYAALQASADQQTIARIIAGCFWLGTLYLAYECFFNYLSYDDQWIYYWRPLRGERQIPWSAVKDVQYSPEMPQTTIKLKTEGYGDLEISPYWDGGEALAERAKAQIEGIK